MKFQVRKRRGAPAIIIVALIDILVVLLIFVMVTTTFKNQPAVQLELPESAQGKTGSSERAPIIVTVAKTSPYFYFNEKPLTFEQLQQELLNSARTDPSITLAIRADTEAPFGQIIRVMDAAKAANVRMANAYVKNAGGGQ